MQQYYEITTIEYRWISFDGSANDTITSDLLMFMQLVPINSGNANMGCN